MTHTMWNPSVPVENFWNEELQPWFGKADLVETANKPRFGKNKPRPKHNVENTLPRFGEKETMKYSEGKKPALILEFRKAGDDVFQHLDPTGVKIFVEKVPGGKKWRAYMQCRGWESRIFVGNDPATALKVLCCRQNVFLHTASMSWWPLDKVFNHVHFVFPFKKRKKAPEIAVRTIETAHVKGTWRWQAK